jgi:hypothetical protein
VGFAAYVGSVCGRKWSRRLTWPLIYSAPNPPLASAKVEREPSQRKLAGCGVHTFEAAHETLVFREPVMTHDQPPHRGGISAGSIIAVEELAALRRIGSGPLHGQISPQIANRLVELNLAFRMLGEVRITTAGKKYLIQHRNS